MFVIVFYGVHGGWLRCRRPPETLGVFKNESGCRNAESVDPAVTPQEAESAHEEFLSGQ